MYQNVKVSPCSRRDLRAFANSVRLATDSMDVFAFPIVEVFEALAAEGYYDFEILPVEEMQNSYGETSYRDDLIRISLVVKSQ